MTQRFTRREFVATAAAAAAGAALPFGPGDVRARPVVRLARAVEPLALPFDLHRVRLRPGRFLREVQTNRAYMMGIAPERLLHTFRLNAKLASAAKPIGGWEAPENELRGHFTGHYLSACALLSAQLGDDAVKARGNQLVTELAKCQRANGNGYLSAFPTEFFDRLRARQRVWAPFYTYHKIMAGLLDMHTLAGNTQALEMAKGMAGWVQRWADPLDDTKLQDILNTEYGGMSDVLYNLSVATGDASLAALAQRFEHARIFTPLAEARDELRDVHANTTIPKIIGAARACELTGEQRYRDIAEYFWRQVTGQRSYATGGTSSGESWPAGPGELAATLGGYTEESCVTYNMLKLTRHLFGWNPDAKYADYYERALYNGMLGTQHPADGEKLYYLPLEAGFWRLFGTPDQAFWCCHGSGIESFSKFGDSIYFHDEAGIFVNLFIASELDWPERGVKLVQETEFPNESVTRFRVQTQAPTRFELRLRVPYWATTAPVIRVNGEIMANLASDGWAALDRFWTTNDRVEMTLPMGLHVDALPDDPTLQAVMYGPLVLALRMGTDELTPETRRAGPTRPRTVPEYPFKAEKPAPAITARSADPSTWVEKLPGTALAFRTVGQATEGRLAPLNEVFDERYAVYFKVTGQR